MRFSFYIISVLILFSGCKKEVTDLAVLDTFSRHQQVEWNETLTDVMVADIFTPPVCSRIYACPHIAAYEVLAIDDAKYKSFAGTLNGLEAIPQPDPNKEYYPPLASMVAFATAAKPLVFAFDKIDTAEMVYLEEIKKVGIAKDIFENSIAYGKTVGQHFVNWSAKDGYLERTALSQYVLSKEEGKWQPTPPDYMPAIEPNWNTMRTYIIDSPDQFKPEPPTDFSIKKNSKFYKEAMEVVEVTKSLDEEKLEIAKFWDCNPNVSHTKGHLMFFDQKISPGGHWMSIAGIAAKQKELSMKETAKIFALTSITLGDAFISCWDEKYRSSLIRPETYINQHIDSNWKPILQTPAFPEHTSGHSVISSAAAVMLTALLGDDFAFTDTTEEKYGLPTRQFKSFYAASDEAAISRLYGGIHYMPAIRDGVTQGKEIGNFMVKNLSEYR